MSQQRNTQSSYTEADIQLAISDIQFQRVRGYRSTTRIYKVPQSTLSDRYARRYSRRDYEPNSKRLSILQEEALVRHILEQSKRGFAPTKYSVRDIANKLLQEQGSKPVGVNWVDNFIKRTLELKTRWSRPYDH